MLKLLAMSNGNIAMRKPEKSPPSKKHPFQCQVGDKKSTRILESTKCNGEHRSKGGPYSIMVKAQSPDFCALGSNLSLATY